MSNNIGISILVLFLLGVAFLRHVSSYDNRTLPTPIVVLPESICAELCRAGLGGKPCGDGCNVPSKLEKGSVEPSDAQSDGDPQSRYKPRTDVCPVLCANHLGYPLCNCTYPELNGRFSTVNFIEICTFYCNKHSYRIAGCDVCEVFQNITPIYDTFRPVSYGTTRKLKCDWNKWCTDKCSEGDGGSACNCDILPMMLALK